MLLGKQIALHVACCFPTLSDAMVGDVNLFFNDSKDASTAEIDIMIAEPGCRGRGLGTEAVTLMMQYGMRAGGVCMCGRVGVDFGSGLWVVREHCVWVCLCGCGCASCVGVPL